MEHLLQAVMAPGDERRDSLFQPDRPLGSLGAKVALARRLGLIDEPVAQAVNALRKLRNAFAHSAGSTSLADPSHSTRLQEAYAHARLNSLWGPLEAALASQPESSQGVLDPFLRDYILLITILVAFLEPTARSMPSPRAICSVSTRQSTTTSTSTTARVRDVIPGGLDRRVTQSTAPRINPSGWARVSSLRSFNRVP